MPRWWTFLPAPIDGYSKVDKMVELLSQVRLCYVVQSAIRNFVACLNFNLPSRPLSTFLPSLATQYRYYAVCVARPLFGKIFVTVFFAVWALPLAQRSKLRTTCIFYCIQSFLHPFSFCLSRLSHDRKNERRLHDHYSSANEVLLYRAFHHTVGCSSVHSRRRFLFFCFSFLNSP